MLFSSRNRYFYGMKNFQSVFFRVVKTQYVYLAILFFGTLQTITAQTNTAPTVTATGAQQYCPGTPLPITTAFNITDPDDATAQAVYIQISSGYVSGQDALSLSLTLPNISSQWDAATAKLSISGTGGQQVPYASLINAVQSVVYTNTATNPASGTRTFSITVGDANYLPSTGHYYKFVAAPNILWTSAKVAAENSTYYGLQGYLATLLSADETRLCGEQTTGTGWIGGSDAAQEGVWKWVTGPEAGITFWNGGVNGSTPNYAFWNTGEPNNLGAENYAHITAPGVGIKGSWNDLANGGSGGEYMPKGYVVEYGGMPGDPPAPNISASTTIEVVRLISTLGKVQCGEGAVILEAVSSGSIVYWYANATGGSPIATGASFTTPVISETTTYYASAYPNSCTTGPRTAVTATINTAPLLTIDPASPICSGLPAQLSASAPSGSTIYWSNTPDGPPIANGTAFTTPPLTEETTYYVRATNNGCPSDGIQSVTVTVLEVPQTQDEDVEFCKNGTTTISAGIPNMEYLWSTGATTEAIQISQEATYSVTITNDAGCSAVKNITTSTLPAADILRVEVNTDVAKVIMADPNTENYLYSLDGESYRESNIFGNLTAGAYTVYVKSKSGCGSDYKIFTVDLIPDFFTPNGDNTNERFTMTAFSLYPNATIMIFDRSGKLITGLNRANRSWDGTFNGNRLPASDYWYVMKLDDNSEEIKGHFSLIR